MHEYPEISRLRKVYETYKISVSHNPQNTLGDKSWYVLVRFRIDDKTHELFVDDEYEDFKVEEPLLHLCLVLRELEGYELAEDYLVWCKERFMDPADMRIKENYEHLGNIYTEVQMVLGEINSHVSNHDFELNAGAAQKLRNPSTQ